MLGNLHQFTVNENGFIKVTIVDNFPFGRTPSIGEDDRKTYALIESSYCLPFVVPMNDTLNDPIKYDAETKSFTTYYGTVIHTHE